MNKNELIKRLRSELSWALASKANNPAYQASLELRREEDPFHINKLGTQRNHEGEDISDLFKDLSEYEDEVNKKT